MVRSIRVASDRFETNGVAFPGMEDQKTPQEPFSAPLSALNETIDVRMLHVEHLSPNAAQPRHIFDADELEQLADSIDRYGLMQPITVRLSAGGAVSDVQSFEIIAGERRWRAVKSLGHKHIAARVMDAPDQYSATLALIENTQRTDLNILEIAQAYQSLIQEHSWTQEQLAEHVSSTRQQVGHILSILRLPESVKRHIAAGNIGLGHAKIIVSLQSEPLMEKLATRIIREGLTVRNCQDLISIGALDSEGLPETGSAGTLDEMNKPGARKGKRKSQTKADWNEWAESFESALDTKVKIESSGKLKKLSIYFSDSADLERIRGLIGTERL